MQSLFWKKVEQNKQTAVWPKVESGSTLTYIYDKNQYIYYGGIKSREIIKQSQFENNVNPNDGQSQFAIEENIDDQSNQINIQSNNLNINKQAQIPTFGFLQQENQQANQEKCQINFSVESSKQQNQNLSVLKLNQFEKKQPISISDVIYIFDPEKGTWKRQICTGKKPPRRIRHVSWYETPYLFIYGGISSDNTILHDMYALNCDIFEWKRFFYIEGAQSKVDFQLVNMGNYKYIIGGASQPDNWLYDDVWSFTLDNVLWQSSQQDLPGIIWEKLILEEAHKLPVLKAHSAVKVSDNEIFIFGGYNEKRQCTDTSILLDVINRKILEFETRGSKPCPRAYHQMIPVKQNIICLFGGVSCPEEAIHGVNVNLLNDFYILYLNEGYWQKPNIGGYIPSPRYHFAAACNQYEENNEIVLFGGTTQDPAGDPRQVYILTELYQKDKEAWGERNEQARLQFEGYKNALKRGKQKDNLSANNIRDVSMITLEFAQAEKRILEQKKQIAEQEMLLKKLKEQNQKTIENHEKYRETIEKRRSKMIEENAFLQIAIEDKKQKKLELNEFISKLLQLVSLERKKRKILKQRSYALQDTLKSAENLIITLDSIYTLGQKEDLLDGIISDDALKKIDKFKNEHKNSLIFFRDQYDVLMQKEQKIKDLMKEKKNSLKPEIEISKEWKKHLNEKDFAVLIIQQKDQDK